MLSTPVMEDFLSLHCKNVNWFAVVCCVFFKNFQVFFFQISEVLISNKIPHYKPCIRKKTTAAWPNELTQIEVILFQHNTNSQHTQTHSHHTPIYTLLQLEALLLLPSSDVGFFLAVICQTSFLGLCTGRGREWMRTA